MKKNRATLIRQSAFILAGWSLALIFLAWLVHWVWAIVLSGGGVLYFTFLLSFIDNIKETRGEEEVKVELIGE